ncbi:MAG TPA: LysR substrate-binding domain-containing protein, partial [Magnetospirillum sp.]|nr:LysR substrate-binding domain-containing protein [Magnetospirillum sp.]
VLVHDAPRDDDHLSVAPLLREPLWAVLPLGHSLAGKDVLEAGDLAGEQLILMELGDGLRNPGLALCKAAGASEHPDFRATSLDSLRQMVATGLGCTLMPALYVEAEAMADPQIAVRRLAMAPSRAIDLVWRRTTSRAEEFRLFGRLVEEHLPPVVERA